jgi:hypothetical protein
VALEALLYLVHLREATALILFFPLLLLMVVEEAGTAEPIRGKVVALEAVAVEIYPLQILALEIHQQQRLRRAVMAVMGLEYQISVVAVVAAQMLLDPPGQAPAHQRLEELAALEPHQRFQALL